MTDIIISRYPILCWVATLKTICPVLDWVATLQSVSSSTYLAWVSICELPVLVLIAVLGLDCYNRWESASGSRLSCYPEASILL